MAVPRNEDTIEGRLDRMEQLLVSVIEQQAAILAKLDEPSVEWLDARSAAFYVSTTERALRRAEQKGHIKAHRSSNGRVLFRRSDLDRFAVANDGGG